MKDPDQRIDLEDVKRHPWMQLVQVRGGCVAMPLRLALMWLVRATDTSGHDAAVG